MTAADRLRQNFEGGADRPCLIDGESGAVLSYGDVAGRALALARRLEARGLQRGDRLAVAMPNSVELAIVCLAALGSGAALVPLGSGFGRREVRDAMQRSRPRLAISDGGPVAAVASELGIEALTAGDVDTSGSDPASGPLPAAVVADDDLASIHFTSGSTGAPRGVGHRLGDFVGNAERYCEASGLDADCRFHHALPMTYMAGYYNLLLLPLTIGASVVIDRAFDVRSVLRFWDVPSRHGANVLWLVPTILAMLLKVDRGGEGRDFCREHVRHAACGTARLPSELRESFEREYGVALHDSYGLSETLLVTASRPESPSPRASVGRPLPGVDVTTDAAGAVLIRTPDAMVGYLERCDDEDRPVFAPGPVSDGWMSTGDLGEFDADGNLSITGRQKDIIIRGGVNVSAVEVEDALRDEQSVERLAVIGIPHEILGEQVAAVVAPRDGAGLEQLEGALRSRAESVLDESRRPDVYVHIDEMPLTPTGKVRKGALRDMVIDTLGLPAGEKGFNVDAPAAVAPSPWPAGTVVDLSHPIEEGMVSFPSPNHPAPEVTVLARHESEGRMTRRLVLGTHTGTHMDAPLHFIPDGTAIDGLALEALVGPAVVADLTAVAPGEEVGVERLREALGGSPRHPRVLLRFGWSERFVDQRFYSESPYLSREAAQWLVDAGVRVLGMDTPSPDDPRMGQDSSDDSPNHFTLLGAGVILLEYLANLEALDAPEVFLVAAPLPVAGGDGAPARVLAIVPET